MRSALGLILSLVLLLGPAAVIRPAAGAASPEQCSISVSISSPANGTVVADLVVVRAQVTSSCQVASVVASVPGQSTPLTFSQESGSSYWGGNVSAAALPRGSFSLVVTATDVFGTVGTKSVSLVRDVRPSISIQSPEVDALSRGVVHIVATCQDDDPAGCSSLTASLSHGSSESGTVVASGVSAIDRWVSMTTPQSIPFDGREAWVSIAALDSRGQRTTVQRRVYTETSRRLVEVLRVPGSILDDSADRTLFADDSRIGWFDKVTQQVTTLLTGSSLRTSGYLTSTGAMFVAMAASDSQYRLYQWHAGQLIDLGSPASSLRVNGNYAIWIRYESGPDPGEPLFRRNLATGETVSVEPSAANVDNDVAVNGDVAYWTLDTGIWRYRDGVRTNLVGPGTGANRPVYPVTDGLNVAYVRTQIGEGLSTWLITPDGEVPLDPDIGGLSTHPHSDYAVANGWTAFNRRANASRNVWTRSPAGVETQRTFFGDWVRVAALDDEGRLAVTRGGRVFVVESNNTTTDVASTWGRDFWRDGHLHVVIGRSLMRVADCTGALSATNVTVAPGAVTGTIAVTAAEGCRWDAFSNSTFVVVNSGSSGTGNGAVTYAVDANSAGQSRSGSITIAGQVVTITQGPVTNAAIAATPSGLIFGGARGAHFLGFIRNFTLPQTVTVSTAGAALAWTAAANQPWVQITSGTGTGPGAFSVAMTAAHVPAGNSLSATVTITASPSGEITTVPVTLTVHDQSAAPFGQVDTPAQNATGVQGAIGITGWALDDLGVTGVKIYRNCLSFDNQANCQTVLGYNVVAVGDASFLPGARTDVESAFSTYPQNTRAGWGVMVLTSMLPHVTSQQPNGGQGPLTLYAVATDAEGTRALLGRAWDSGSAGFATPTQITMANDSIAKPFGAIDTPAPGQTVSGVLNNFGWALTPDSNATGGEAGDILIPTNGSTMTVYIDGMPVAQVAFNQCRGNVGNPVPTGVFCNDDVSSIFGNATPQPVLTARTGNPTRYRNLDAARAAIGLYSFNTSTLSNGLHTIAWSVTDSANRTEGIGSRFFIVLNSGAR